MRKFECQRRTTKESLCGNGIHQSTQVACKAGSAGPSTPSLCSLFYSGTAAAPVFGPFTMMADGPQRRGRNRKAMLSFTLNGPSGVKGRRMLPCTTCEARSLPCRTRLGL